MKKSCILSVQGFDWENITPGTESFYQSVIAGYINRRWEKNR